VVLPAKREKRKPMKLTKEYNDTHGMMYCIIHHINHFKANGKREMIYQHVLCVSGAKREKK